MEAAFASVGRKSGESSTPAKVSNASTHQSVRTQLSAAFLRPKKEEAAANKAAAEDAAKRKQAADAEAKRRRRGRGIDMRLSDVVSMRLRKLAAAPDRAASGSTCS